MTGFSCFVSFKEEFGNHSQHTEHELRSSVVLDMNLYEQGRI